MTEPIWFAYEYESVWSDLYSKCDSDTQCTIDNRLDALREKGNSAPESVWRHCEDGIFELRAKNARFLFYFSERRSIVFVHSLFWNRDDLPRKDSELAKKRRDEIARLELKSNALPDQKRSRAQVERQELSS
jgi:Gp49-like protein DUF891